MAGADTSKAEEQADGTAAVVDAELERCAGISRNDFAVVESLLADDLTYTHTNGHTEGKIGVLEGLRQHPRTVERGQLGVRVLGDFAIMTGDISLSFPPEEPNSDPRQIQGVALQVWKRSGGRWQLAACQVTAQASAS